MDDPSALAQSQVPVVAQPRLAVLPFEVEGVEQETAFLREALADEIAADLSRIGRLFVIARLTTFNLTSEDALSNLVEADLDYLIQGRVLQDGTVLTVEAQLRSARTNDILDRFSLRCRVDDLFQAVDGIVDAVLLHIGQPLAVGSHERARRRRQTDPIAYRSYSLAWQALWSLTREGSTRAKVLLEKAFDRDRKYAPALGLYAFIAARDFRRGWSRSKLQADDVARRYTDAALEADYDDPIALWTSGFAEAMLFRRYAVSVDLMRRSIAIDPCASHVLTWASLFNSYYLDFNNGLALATRSMTVSPRDAMAVTQRFAAAFSCIHAQRDEEAILFTDQALALDPHMVNVLRFRAVACVRLGRIEEAHSAINQILALDPNESIHLIAKINPLREWPGFSAFLDGLRMAGLPEG